MEEKIEELISQAVDLLKNGQIERAEMEFRKILKLFPNHHLSIGTMGDFYLQVGRSDLALSFLRRLKAMKPNDYLSHYLLGVAYGKMGRFFLSLEELKKANELKSNNPEVIRQMALSLGIKGEIEEGRKLLKGVISFEPEAPEAYADLGASYLFNAEYEKVEEYLKKSLSLDPDYEPALQLLEDFKTDQVKFEKLSLAEREKRRKEIQSQEYKRQMRIDLMMDNLSQMEATEEDLAEVTLEFKEMGLSGQITMFHDPNTPEGRAAIEYVERHKKIKNIDSQKLSPKEIDQITNKLLDKKTILEEKKDLILTLAHQAENEALEGLKQYAKNSDRELKIWVQMAVDECKSFLAGKILDEPVIQIHKIGKDKEDKKFNLMEKIKNILKKRQ